MRLTGYIAVSGINYRQAVTLLGVVSARIGE